MQQNNVDRDYLETLTRRIEALEQQILQMRNNMKPTVPIYDPAAFPQNPVEGQIALGTDGKAYKYQSAAWAPMGGGISFDTYPQAGNWLYIETDDETGAPHGYGLQIVDISAGGLEISSGSGSIDLGQVLGLLYDVLLSSNDGIGLYNSGSNEIRVRNHTIDGLTIEDLFGLTTGNGIKIYSSQNDVLVEAGDIATLEGKKVILANHSSTTTDLGSVVIDTNRIEFLNVGGSPIFRIIRVAGVWEYHIITGASWVADL